MKKLINKYQPLATQFMTFALGGGVNILLNLGLTWLLTDYFKIYYLVSFAIVQLIIIIYGFIYNTYLTFRLKKASSWIFIKFIFFLHLFALINILLVRLFTDVVGIQYLLSITLTIILTIFFRFYIYKRYVFIDQDSWLKNITVNNYLILIIGIILYVILLFVYGFIPGLYLNDLSAYYLMSANTQCLLNQGILNLSYCQNFGYPHGFPFIMGLPFIYISAIISKIFFIDAYLANIITGTIFLLLAFIGSFLFFYKLKINKFVAIFLTFIWLILSITSKQSGYHYLMYGFMLVPVYIIFDIYFIENYKSISNHHSRVLVLLLIIFRTFVLFMDGYSFIISAVPAFLILVYSVYKEKRNLWKLLIYLVANLLAIAIYKIYSGSVSYGVMPLDFFRAQGIDLISLFTPNNFIWWAGWLNIGYKWNDYTLGYQYYGDGSNIFYSYIGFSFILIAILFFVRKIKTTISQKIILISGIIALILSFGPSIKINNYRQSEIKQTLTFNDYLMPAEDTTYNLPYEKIFTFLPGLNNMRAIHRWLLLFKLSLLLLTGLVLTSLIKNKNKKYVFLFGLIILIEIFPNLKIYNQKYSTNLQQLNLFNQDVIKNLSGLISVQDKILFASNPADDNDYLANYISASLNAKSYNCGVDKNIEIAKNYWPEEVMAINKNLDTEKNILYLLNNNQVDKVIYPYFSLRWNSYYWPPDQSTIQKLRDNIPEKLLLNHNLDIEDYDFFAIITKKEN